MLFYWVFEWLVRIDHKCIKRLLQSPLHVLFSLVGIKTVSNFADSWERLCSFAVVETRNHPVRNLRLWTCHLVFPLRWNRSCFLASGNKCLFVPECGWRPQVLIDLVKMDRLLKSIIGSGSELCWLNGVWDKLTKSFIWPRAPGARAAHVAFQTHLVLVLAFFKALIKKKLTIGHVKCAGIANC